jgi:hypothetical protein
MIDNVMPQSYPLTAIDNNGHTWLVVGWARSESTPQLHPVAVRTPRTACQGTVLLTEPLTFRIP